MSSGKMSKLCQSVLPAEFEQVVRLGPGIQSFLEQNLPEAVNQCATLLNINQDEIVIGATTPLVTNYLRLHSREIEQQLRETFGFEQKLKFRTVPESLLKLDRKEIKPRLPQTPSADSIEALERNAQWIEDGELKAALLSLAASLKSD